MAIAAAWLAREAVGRGAIPPGLVAVGWQACLTGRSLRIVLALANGVYVCATATGMPIARTPKCKLCLFNCLVL